MSILHCYNCDHYHLKVIPNQMSHELMTMTLSPQWSIAKLTALNISNSRKTFHKLSRHSQNHIRKAAPADGVNMFFGIHFNPT